MAMKFYCDSCGTECKKHYNVRIDTHREKTFGDEMLRYDMDLCERCHTELLKWTEKTGIEPQVDPYG